MKGGGCMIDSDISDIKSMNKVKMKRRRFYELQPRNT